jgi:hypothetical protein
VINSLAHGDDGWDESGRPRRLPRIDNAGHADLIAQAQRAFIASGFSIEEARQSTLPHAEDVAAVRGRLADLRDWLSNYLDRFDRTWCDAHAKMVKRYNWTIVELHGHYMRAIQVTNDTAARFPR